LSWPWVALLLVVLSVAMHASLVVRLSTGVPADLGDPLLNMWILWWNAQQIPFTDAYWNAPAFAPMPRALGLSETLLGLTWFTTPMQWLGASPVTAYNLLYIAEPVLNGLSAYWLCLVLTARRDAALIGALAMAFAPYHATQISHIQTEGLFFMPIALVALHRYWTTGNWRWLILLTAATALNALVCGYFLLFFSTFLGVALLWYVLATRDVKKLVASLASLAVAILAISPVIVMFRLVRLEHNLSRLPVEIERNSADVTSFALASHLLTVWPIHTEVHQPQLAAYPGLVIVLVIFMLIQREDLRNRLIRLVGYGSLTVTNQALEEAGQRISRYLLMQTIINSSFGLAVGFALYLIGLPYAILWGFLAMALRFVPYIGPFAAAMMPSALSLAVFEGWYWPMVVAGLFLALELLINMVLEPLLYGESAGVSGVGLVVAIAFWTWLWGPVGLVLATPLTVCVVVLGKYVPGMDFIGVLISDRSARNQT